MVKFHDLSTDSCLFTVSRGCGIGWVVYAELKTILNFFKKMFLRVLPGAGSWSSHPYQTEMERSPQTPVTYVYTIFHIPEDSHVLSQLAARS